MDFVRDVAGSWRDPIGSSEMGGISKMPELPEVETMVRGLRPALAGRQTVAAGASRCLTRARLFGGRLGAIRPGSDDQRGGSAG